MISLSAISKAEKNKLSTNSIFHILLEIRLSDVIYICYNNENVTWKGQEYLGFPFEIGEISDQMDGSDPNVSLKISNVARGFQWYIEDSEGAVGVEVILRVVNSLNMNGDADLEEFFTVIVCNVDEQWITFTLGNGYSAKSIRPLDRYMKNHCPYRYKGIRCGYNGNISTCNHTLIDCRNHSNSQRFGGYSGIDQQGVYANG